MAGIWTLPYSIGSSVTSVLSGVMMSRTGLYRPAIWLGLGLITVGEGLMTMLDGDAKAAGKIMYTFIAALGLGCLFQSPLIGIQAAMPTRDMATSTSTFQFIRTIGATISISLGQAIFSSALSRNIRRAGPVPPLLAELSASELIGAAYELKNIEDPALYKTIVDIYAKATTWIWVLVTSIAGLSLIMSLLLKEYTLRPDLERPVATRGLGGESDSGPEHRVGIRRSQQEEIATRA